MHRELYGLVTEGRDFAGHDPRFQNRSNTGICRKRFHSGAISAGCDAKYLPSIYPLVAKQVWTVSCQYHLAPFAVPPVYTPPSDRYTHAIYQTGQPQHDITVKGYFRFFQQERAATFKQ